MLLAAPRYKNALPSSNSGELVNGAPTNTSERPSPAEATDIPNPSSKTPLLADQPGLTASPVLEPKKM